MTAVPPCFFFSVLRLNPPVRMGPLCTALLGRAVQQLRAAVHQLHQREVAAVLQPPHVHPRARGIQARGHWVDIYRLRHGPPADYWFAREGITWPRQIDRSWARSPRRLGFLRIAHIRSRYTTLNVFLSCLSARSNTNTISYHHTFIRALSFFASRRVKRWSNLFAQ